MARELPRRAASPLLAVLIHVLAVGIVYRMPRDRAASVAPVQNTEPTIDVSLDAPAVSAAPAPPPSTPSVTAPQRVAHAAGPETAAPSGSSVVASSDAPSNVPAEAPAAGGAPIAFGPAQVPDLGIGKNPFLVGREGPDGKSRDERAVERSMRDVAERRDRELGLGPEGPLLTALGEGTAQSLAPVRGRAVFSATSNESGEVVSIDVLDTEGGRPGWVDAARIALERLKGKKLRVRPGSARTTMKVEVTSAWKLPSGQDPGTDMTLFHVPIAKGEGKDSPQLAILDPIPKFRVQNIELGPGIVIPLLTVEIDLFRMTADPSNLGAKPRRVIHTHVIESTAL